MMTNNINQRGVGMIEVLVSLVLLSVAVLGFVSLQMRAVQSTDESLKRTQAMSIIRGLAESMRVHPSQLDVYQTVINDISQAKDNVTAVSCEDLNPLYSTVDPDKKNACTAEHIAGKEAVAVLDKADSFDVSLSIVTCPGTEVTKAVPTPTTSDYDRSVYQLQKLQELKCIIAAWEDTTATLGDAKTDCADEEGVYKTNASCIIVEAY